MTAYGESHPRMVDDRRAMVLVVLDGLGDRPLAELDMQTPAEAASTPHLDALAARLHKHGLVTVNEFMLRTQISENDTQYEITLFRDGRAIVKGTEEPGIARSVYAKYVGA